MLKKQLIYFILSTIVFTSCKKYLDVGSSPTQLNSTAVFKSDATAIAAQLAIYEQMESDGLGFYMMANTGLSSDELTNYIGSTNYVELATNNLTATNSNVLNLWSSFYKYIYEANAVIEGVQTSPSITETTSKELTGEAKFTRAFCHFYLVNFFGEVPLALTTDYNLNATSSRKPIDTVYAQIRRDLNDAISLLPDKFLAPNGAVSQERIRPTKWAAEALLARVELYTGDWSAALNLATDIIGNTSMFSILPDLNQVFLKNNGEAIWQLQSVIPRFNSFVGALMVTSSAPSTVALSSTLVSSFEAGDKRSSAWINSVNAGGNLYYYPYKYKVGQGASTVTEYTTVMRLAEVYLIRAEAFARLNDFVSAAKDINLIRSRASLPPVNPSSQAECLEIIRKERNAELFAEFGDRWFDLKRTGVATTILQPVKGNDWTSGVDELYPIPQSEIVKNSRLTQNSGY
jgi:hypothetical protein